ncbi:MAG: MlaD family protein [Marinilabiliaceae bacterium]|jgi:phospholipid/cholesterol/gamma-HCH transport system substrate-binding protein|nr:MlaD family protein [Marinilabiliaceae bacterium]
MSGLSAELKVGVVSVFIIVLFIWLFSFLKGDNLLKGGNKYYIFYNNIAGLEEASPVEINGLKAGIVEDVKLVNDGSGIIEVIISINKDYKIPLNSVAEITTATLLAGMKIDLVTGDSNKFHVPGDTITGRLAVSVFDKLNSGLDPLLESTGSLIARLDTISIKLNALFTNELKTNITEGTSSLKSAGHEFNMILQENRQDINELISGLNKVSSMIEGNSSKLDSTINNLNNISTSIADSGLDSVLVSFKQSVSATADILTKINSGKGSAGKLVDDDSLYINLSNSLRSLDELLSDIENNPGRYVNISLFGNRKKR